MSEVIEYFGTENANNNPAKTQNQRAGRCFELAGYAIALGTAPCAAILVHGSMHGLKAAQRIEHAWLILLDTEEIWEPMQGRRWRMDTWRVIARPHPIATYGKPEVHEMIQRFGNWGPWHDLPAHDRLPGMMETDVPGV